MDKMGTFQFDNMRSINIEGTIFKFNRSILKASLNNFDKIEKWLCLQKKIIESTKNNVTIFG